MGFIRIYDGIKPLVICCSSLLKNDPVEIVDLPIQKMVTFQFPNFFSSLPEGRFMGLAIYPLVN